jgi:hypothetical protein
VGLDRPQSNLLNDPICWKHLQNLHHKPPKLIFSTFECEENLLGVPINYFLLNENKFLHKQCEKRWLFSSKKERKNNIHGMGI